MKKPVVFIKQQADMMNFLFYVRLHHTQPHCLKQQLSQRQEKSGSTGYM